MIRAENVSFIRDPAVSRLGTAARVGGRAVVAVGAAYDVYRIATAENKARTASGVVGGWAGAAAGGKVGAGAGAAVGAWFGGVGAVPGAVIGGIIGGIGGYWAGSNAGQNIYDAVTE